MNRSHPAAPRATIEPLEARQLFAVGLSTIDVAVVYTPAAKADVGGLQKLTQRVERAVADTNLVLANSRVDATVRLVSLTEMAYSETSNLSNDLDRLQAPGDGHLDGIHALRNSTGADLVHLLVAEGDDGGRAYQLDDPSRSWAEYGFAVSQARYVNTDYIFAHETMHNLGAGHDDTDASHRRLPYAYGLGVRTGAQLVHTLLGPGTRIPYLSSPDLTWRGQSLGAASGSALAQQLGHGADNARAVRSFAPVVAANRPSRIADTAAPAARFLQAWTSPSSKTLSLQVSLADDTAINVATLDSSDLRVTGPNGFSRTATFASVDRSSSGGQRLAKYTVDITGFPADASLYSFNLNPNQIADLGGRTVAGGTLGVSGSASRFADRAGDSLHTSLNLGTIDGTNRRLGDAITDLDASNYYRFTVGSATTLKVKLSGMSADADLRLIQDSNGNGAIDAGDILSTSAAGGTTPDQINRFVQSGIYGIWVSPSGASQTTYSLSLSASGSSTPVSPPTAPPPPRGPIGAGTVRGSIWRDNNSNGVFDSWEMGLGGWKVYADVDNNGRYDTASDVAATTAADGSYTLANLPARSYTLRSIDQSGYRRTTAASRVVSLSSGQTAGQQNFGHTPRLLISGTVFADGNANQLRDSGEVGSGGWNVFLDKNGNNRLDADEFWTTTDAQGKWAIKDAMAGSYVVRLASRAGFSITTPSAGHSLTMTAGQISSAKVFGIRQL